MTNVTGVTDARVPGSSGARLQILRTRLFEVAVLLWSLPYGLAILTIFKLWRPPSVVRWILRRWSSGFIAMARWIVGVNYRIEGAHHLPDSPAIFVCNHQSYWESIALTALIPHINVITKAGAMDIPVFGWGLRHAPMIPVHRELRGLNLRRIVRQARDALAEGRSVLLFPEGTRVQPGATRPYLRGLALLYEQCGVPIIPVVHNAGLFWTEGFQVKSSGTVTLRFCPPIAAGGDGAKVAAGLEAMMNREKETLPGLDAGGSARKRT